MDRSMRAVPLLAALVLGLTGCWGWGTEDEAREIYWKHKDIFHAMYDEIHSQPAIRRVEDSYDPSKIEGLQSIETFGPFTEETRKIYKQVVAQMPEAEVQTIVVARGPGTDGRGVEIVDFIVFRRGLGSNTEGISIVAVHSRRPGAMDPGCQPIDPPVWRLCHTK